MTNVFIARGVKGVGRYKLCCWLSPMLWQEKIKHYGMLILFLFFSGLGTAKAQELTIFVDNWPPYNFEENGKVVGISTELIEEALKELDVSYKLVMYPFKRALVTVQRTPNTMLYTVARVPQRESSFKWIGPIHPRSVYLYKLKNRTDIQINQVEDMRKYVTGALLGGSIEQFLMTHGFKKSQEYLSFATAEQLLKVLFARRVDVIPGDPLDLAYQIKNLGYDFSELEQVYHLSDEGGYYLVANNETSNELVSKIQASLNQVLADGVRERVIKKYLD